MNNESQTINKRKKAIYYVFQDNKDFYPTPRDLFYKLMNGKRYIGGRILEPSAGKGEFTLLSKQEFECDLLRFKMFKNGNIHVWFKDEKLLNKLNYLCGSHFAWIPSEDEVRTNEKAREFVVREFGAEAVVDGFIEMEAS